MKRKLAIMAMALTGLLTLPQASAQITNTVFSEDFTSKTLDANKIVFQDHSLEGGKGDIAPVLHDGVVEFTGTVTEQWWAGATLRVVPTFTANSETNVMVSVDRVSEAGTGSATRSCLWIMDPSRTFFVLFAEDRAETAWEYNRYIGTSGDSQTGSGNAITKFDTAGSAYMDEGLHRMKAIANGKTVKLYLDDVFGVEVAFPFNNLVFEIGAAARANNDVADATFDNLRVQTIGATAFSQTAVTLVSGQTASGFTVRIPTGLNSTSPVTVRVVSSDPTIAIPVGATGDTLTLTFAAGGSNEQTVGVKSVGPAGGAQLTLANDLGMASANALSVVVVEGAGVRVADDFASSSIDASKWTNSDVAFEAGGLGTFTAKQTGGQLVLSGTLDSASYWGGISLNTVKTFTATPELPLSFEMDRISIDPTDSYGTTPSTAARTGVFITTADRANYIFFGQNVSESGWEVNLNATGSGTTIPAFSGITNNGLHHMKIVADGSTVQLYLDGIYGGSYAFAVSMGIQFEVGVYARDVADAVKGVFDNVSIANVYPPVSVAPTSVSTFVNLNTNTVTVTVPKFLAATKAMNVTVTSQNPSVAAPVGAVNGVLTLAFAAGGANTQTFQVKAVGTGTTALVFTNDQALTTDNQVSITVTPAPKVVFSDDFSGAPVDSSKWVVDSTPLVSTGTLSADSGVYTTNGMLEIAANCVDADWPGMALLSKSSYAASELSPVDFDIDRTKMEFVLFGGSGTLERTGVWIKDSTTNYVFFNYFDNHDATVIGGWQYNAVIGAAGDIALPASAKVIPAFTGTSFLDLGYHHMKVQVNGKEAKLYLDGIFGASAPFPFSTGIVFGVGAYVNYANAIGSTVHGFFDNATITEYPPSVALGSLAAARQANGDLVISWTGAGTLQSTAALPGGWSNVSPAPSGTSYTITAASLKGQKFFRLSQ